MEPGSLAEVVDLQGDIRVPQSGGHTMMTIAAWGYGVASSFLVWAFSNSFHSRPCGGGRHQSLVHRVYG